jgi:hypothetical protein
VAPADNFEEFFFQKPDGYPNPAARRRHPEAFEIPAFEIVVFPHFVTIGDQMTGNQLSKC